MSDLKLDVHALVDGENIDSERAQLLAAMEQDSTLKAEYEWAVYIKRTLNDKCKSQGSDECWQSAIVQLNAIDKTKRTENFIGRYAWAFCGVFVLAIGIASVSNQITGRTSLATTSSAGFASLTPIQKSVNADEALEAIKARLGSAPATLSATPVLMVDQVLYGVIDGHKAMMLRFADRKGPLDLTFIQGVGAIDTINTPIGDGMSQGQINGINAVSWSDGQCLTILASQRPFEELAANARGIQLAR
jgi:hypothetical protein